MKWFNTDKTNFVDTDKITDFHYYLDHHGIQELLINKSYSDGGYRLSGKDAEELWTLLKTIKQDGNE